MIYLELFFIFLKIGAFTFGGGLACLPLIENEIISRGWMSNDELTNFIAVSESTPGSLAVNCATYIGSEIAGFFGAVCATLGVVLPSFVIILIVARFFMKVKDNRIASGCMTGMKPAVVGLIAAAALSIGSSVFAGSSGFTFDFTFLATLAIFIIMLLLEILKAHPMLIIALSAVFGIAAGELNSALHT